MRKRKAIICVMVCVAFVTAYGRSDEMRITGLEYRKESARPTVETIHSEWMDEARKREVPFKIYYPGNGDGPFPVVIFSPGLGGTRQTYEYVGRHWAGNGYVSVHLQHKGSDNAIFLKKADPVLAAKDALKDINNFLERPKDVSFAIDQIEKLNKDESSPLKGRLNLKKIAVAGHSLGAYTSLASGGRVLIGPRGRELDLSDPRIIACVAMSEPADDTERTRQSYGRFHLPCLHITGDKDRSPIAETKPEHRRIPFDAIKKGDQYLLIFKDADHMVFTGQSRKTKDEKKDRLIHDLVKLSSTVFLDAYLRDSAEAKKWLMDDGLEAALGRNGTFEKKLNEK